MIKYYIKFYAELLVEESDVPNIDTYVDSLVTEISMNMEMAGLPNKFTICEDEEE